MSSNTVSDGLETRSPFDSSLARLLEYFGELFPSSECKRALTTECDNCRQHFQTSAIDCTRMSVEILKLVSELSPNYLTLPYIMDILRGVNNRTIQAAGHQRLRAFNSCQQLTRLGQSRSRKENLNRTVGMLSLRSRAIDFSSAPRWLSETRIHRTTFTDNHRLSPSRHQCRAIDIVDFATFEWWRKQSQNPN